MPNYQDYSEEIEEFTVQHDTDSGEITCVLPDTPTEIDTCYYHKCLCALNLATNIYDEMVAKQDTTYSWNETCEVSAPSNLVKDRCCYIDQIWYPYSSVMSNCPVESSTTTAPPEPETLVLSNQEVKDLCANTKFDFTIINDGSNSISNSNWQKTINFLNQLVSQFLSVGVQHRVTVMQFSSYNKFYTTMDHSTQGVTQALNAMRRDQIKQHTMTNYALEAAYNAIRNNRRRTTPQVALVLTDGKSTNGLGMSHITNGNTASQLRNYGVKVFTIGVTDSVDLAELQDIASDPDETYLEQLEDFDALSSFKLNLAQEMCTNYNRNLDVLDIIDFLGDKNLDAEENLEDDEGIDSHTDLIGVEYIVDNLSLEDRLYLDTLLLEQPE